MLTHDQLHLAVLGSGSRGNCAWVGTETHGVLIDCGLSKTAIFSRLQALGLQDVPIDAVLLTHEHTDHVGGAGILSRYFKKKSDKPVPFYMTEGTASGLHPRCKPEEIRLIRAGQTLALAPEFEITAHPIPHDTPDPVAWSVQARRAIASVVTDLGCTPHLIREVLAASDLAIVEFNHDVERLMDGPYPWRLKQRIRSRHGHLSNDDARNLLHAALSQGRLKGVVLGHLSEQNNTPELAQIAADEAIAASHATHVRVHVGDPFTPVQVSHDVPTPLGLPTPAMQTSLFG